MNFPLKGLFFFLEVLFFQDFFDWFFHKKSFSPRSVFPKGFFSDQGVASLSCQGVAFPFCHGGCSGLFFLPRGCVSFFFLRRGCVSVGALCCPSCFSKDLFFVKGFFQMFIIFISLKVLLILFLFG